MAAPAKAGQCQPGANVIEVVDRVQQRLPTLRASLPGNLNVAVLTDRTQPLRALVTDVQYELGLAILLVVNVISLSIALGGLFSLPNRIWTLGPALAETIFEGGAQAAVKQAAASYDQIAVNYRGTVLSALAEC